MNQRACPVFAGVKYDGMDSYLPRGGTEGQGILSVASFRVPRDKSALWAR